MQAETPMENPARLLIIVVILLLNVDTSQAQIWPVTPMLRFGNIVYYPIDSLSADKLTGTSISFDKKITNRYFDILAASDSIGLFINDTIYYYKSRMIQVLIFVN